MPTPLLLCDIILVFLTRALTHKTIFFISIYKWTAKEEIKLSSRRCYIHMYMYTYSYIYTHIHKDFTILGLATKQINEFKKTKK